MTQVTIARTPESDPDVALPSYTTAGAAGADVRANFASAARAEGIDLQPGARVLVPTGLRLAIPEGFEIQVRPRSGLAFKQGVTVVNAPGTIDSDYRGELGVLLVNLGSEAVNIAHGDRIAQLVLAPVIQAQFSEGLLDDTARGAGGFGSTGRT